MEEDPDYDRNDEQDRIPRRDDNGNSGGGGGGGFITALLPFLLTTVLRRPKILIPILLIGGFFYFFGGGLFNSNSGGSDTFSKGMEMKQEIFDQAEVFEPLADNAKNPLPEKVSLLEYAPERLNQGRQGSCVGWASSYGARSILYARQNNTDPNKMRFSPSFLYNQIALEGCQGSYMVKAMQALQGGGTLPLKDFAYDDQDCETTPNAYQRQEASKYRIAGYNRLTQSGDDYKIDLLAIKQNLAQGAPVVIGMMVGGSFMQDMEGQNVWFPNEFDYSQNGFGGHAMCVIGYDDYLEGGCFQLMNSWGMQWGNKGCAYVRYKDFEFFTKEAYGLYPMGNGRQFDENKLSVKFGLYNVATKGNIPLVQKAGNVFGSKVPLKKGNKFKIEVTNSIECYVYIFGEETDRSSYVLFPYTKKHSPYCGITGTRLFPKDYNMKVDELGNKDLMAVIISKKPLDYNSLNTRINSSRAATYQQKVDDAIASEKIASANFNSAGDVVNLDCALNGKNAISFIIEIDK